MRFYTDKDGATLNVDISEFALDVKTISMPMPSGGILRLAFRELNEIVERLAKAERRKLAIAWCTVSVPQEAIKIAGKIKDLKPAVFKTFEHVEIDMINESVYPFVLKILDYPATCDKITFIR